MCGIGAIISKSEQSPVTLQEATQLLRDIDVKGGDACGIYIEWFDDTFTIFKLPVSGKYLASRFEKCRVLREVFEKPVRILIAHSRLPTKGSVYENENNHPLWEIFDNYLVVVVHNGMIVEDSEDVAFKEREVDSDVLLAYLRKTIVDKPRSVETILDLIVKCLKKYLPDSTLNTIWRIYPSRHMIISNSTSMELYMSRDGSKIALLNVQTFGLSQSYVKDSGSIDIFSIYRLDIDTLRLEKVHTVEISKIVHSHTPYTYIDELEELEKYEELINDDIDADSDIKIDSRGRRRRRRSRKRLFYYYDEEYGAYM